MVDFTFIYSSAVNKIRELIQDGELGEMLYFDSKRSNLGLIRPDVNVAWDLAVHDISILLYLLGERPTTVSAVGTSRFSTNLVCTAYLSLLFPKNFVAQINVNWLSPQKIRQIIIGGTKRMVVYNDDEMAEKIRIYDRGIVDLSLSSAMKEIATRITVDYRFGDIVAPSLDRTEPLVTEIDHFVECILEHKTPKTDSQMGLTAIHILEAVDCSIKEKGKPFNVEYKMDDAFASPGRSQSSIPIYQTGDR